MGEVLYFNKFLDLNNIYFSETSRAAKNIQIWL